MAHGYLEDGYGTHGEIDPDRGDDRRNWRERNWRGRDDDWSGRDRERGMMFGDNERGWRGQRSQRWAEEPGRGDSYDRQSEDWSGQRRHSANPDDHYRSWRERHMGELDRDYEDYCREREQQFHRDFDDWRRQRHGNPQPLRTGMTQSGLSHDPTGELQLETEAIAPIEPDAVADATLGTNADTRTGRGRR